MTDKLKPCPFCNEANRIHIRRQGNHAYRVICHNCGALVPYAKVEEYHKDKFIAQDKRKLYGTGRQTMADRDRLIELIKHGKNLAKHIQTKSEEEHIADYLIANGVILPPCDAKSIIHSKEQCPTADVVEVVRCKDCEYCCISTDPKTNTSIQKCGYVGFNPMQSSQVSDDFYCGYGELKEREGK